MDFLLLHYCVFISLWTVTLIPRSSNKNSKIPIEKLSTWVKITLLKNLRRNFSFISEFRRDSDMLLKLENFQVFQCRLVMVIKKALKIVFILTGEKKSKLKSYLRLDG